MFPSNTNYYLGNLALFDNNRESAVSYWLKAKENWNANAVSQLNLFHNYSGRYLLVVTQVTAKLTTKYNLSFGDGKYISGIDEIDKNEKINSLKTEIREYDNGLEIELRKTFKAFHIAIAFYEIDDITYDENMKIFELILADKSILKFNYDQSKDYNEALKKVCNSLKEKTVKTPTALSYWNK